MVGYRINKLFTCPVLFECRYLSHFFGQGRVGFKERFDIMGSYSGRVTLAFRVLVIFFLFFYSIITR